MAKQCLWVFGNAVQDITVEVDIERLSHEPGNKKGEMMRLSDRGLKVNPALRLIVQMGSRSYSIPMELERADDQNTDSWPTLRAGQKYTLNNEIGVLTGKVSAGGGQLILPCEGVTWGGGGTNATTFLRAFVPDKDKLPIRYTDIAMGHSLVDSLRPIAGLYGNSANSSDERSQAEAENHNNRLAAMISTHGPDSSLEVYLASLPVESVIYRPTNPRFRRNLVFSRVRSASREINNKIILRGQSSNLPPDRQERILKFLQHHEDHVGVILLNSIKDEQMFKAAYSFYESLYQNKGEHVAAILAMTEPMQKFTEWMKKETGDISNGKFPPFILVFNETEAHSFATKLGMDGKPFMKNDGAPDIKKFAELAIVLRNKFDPERIMPRIYVTIGSRGSLGVDRSGHVVYVWRYSKTGASIYDTNACGDAYCAAIALLEWAKRHGHPNIAGVDFPSELTASAHEMEYFMAVATAAAYCKATNRHGRIRQADLKELLQRNHLASAILPTVDELANMTADRRPECVDENFHLREPSPAKFHGTTKDLLELLA